MKLAGCDLLFSILCSERMSSGGQPPRGRHSMDSKGLSHCARCGAVLASPDAVCERCDRKLDAPVVAASPKPAPAVGRYRCPRCAEKFDSPDSAAYPVPYLEQTPLYRYRPPIPRCPHCGCLLRDRSLWRFPAWITWACFLGLMPLWRYHELFRSVSLAFAVVFLGVPLFFYARYSRKEYRYAAMSAP